MNSCLLRFSVVLGNILYHIIMVVANFDTCVGFVVGDGMQICKDPDRPSNSEKYST